jgi:hypothetical protein
MLGIHPLSRSSYHLWTAMGARRISPIHCASESAGMLEIVKHDPSHAVINYHNGSLALRAGHFQSDCGCHEIQL